MNSRIIFLLASLCMVSCGTRKVPKVKLSQFPPGAVRASYSIEGQQAIFQIRNELLSPVRISIHTEDTLILNHLEGKNSLVVGSERDTTFRIGLSENHEPQITFASALGNPSRKVSLNNVSLPIKKNTPVSVIQAYNGEYSHNSDYSRYAIDFNIREDDTIFAATDGVVIGVIKDYMYGGAGVEWKGYDNFITIFDPDSGLYTQYSHLAYQGSHVAIGDRVKQGEPIGLSGKTGFADMPHLHFNTLIPLEGGEMISVPVEFIEGYKGKDLQKNQKVIKPGS